MRPFFLRHTTRRDASVMCWSQLCGQDDWKMHHSVSSWEWCQTRAAFATCGPPTHDLHPMHRTGTQRLDGDWSARSFAPRHSQQCALQHAPCALQSDKACSTGCRMPVCHTCNLQIGANPTLRHSCLLLLLCADNKEMVKMEKLPITGVWCYLGSVPVLYNSCWLHRIVHLGGSGEHTSTTLCGSLSTLSHAQWQSLCAL